MIAQVAKVYFLARSLPSTRYETAASRSITQKAWNHTTQEVAAKRRDDAHHDHLKRAPQQIDTGKAPLENANENQRQHRQR
jgi:hypothetical protein